MADLVDEVEPCDEEDDDQRQHHDGECDETAEDDALP